MELIDFVRKGISGHIILKSQLKFGYYSFVEGNFEGNVRDGDRFSEPALDFKDSKPLWVNFPFLLDILFDAFNGLDDILDF